MACDPKDGDRSARDADDLSKDSWSLGIGKVETRPPMRETAPASTRMPAAPERPSAPPVSAGYAGRRPKDSRFAQTLGVSAFAPPAVAPQRYDITEKMILVPAAEPERPASETAPIPLAILAPASPASQGKLAAPANAPRDSIEALGLAARPDPGKPLQMSLSISTAVLCALWFIPDLVGPDVIFPWTALRTAEGLRLPGIVVQPVAAALLLAALVAPIGLAVRAALGLVLGLCVMLAPTLLGALALPADPTLIAAGVAAAFVLSYTAFVVVGSAVAGHALLALVPLVLLAIAVDGAVAGEVPVRFLAAFKTPLALYAGLLAADSGAAFFFNRK
ncbi:MAG: hypothetical protein PHU25_12150 [Deltaproteobacteria bacterium]|nr:hypothetical protein [Deltaproteobacteria bacterium]